MSPGDPKLSAFAKELAARTEAGGSTAFDEAAAERNRAVPAHTVIRQNGRIVAAVWRDGQTLMSNAMAAKIRGFESQMAGLNDAARRNAIAEAMIRELGPSATVERYGETGPAPTKGETVEEFSQANLRARGGR
ncbi:hypothetical protein [Azospirillum sp. A39]|uniref:hypothetical protein n=1 Tax=Azospirillum sp. A39 TaxID=3462279 RepID=UPI0040460B28